MLKAAGLSVEKIMDTVNSFIQHGYTIQNHDHWLNSGKIQALLTNHD